MDGIYIHVFVLKTAYFYLCSLQRWLAHLIASETWKNYQNKTLLKIEKFPLSMLLKVSLWIGTASHITWIWNGIYSHFNRLSKCIIHSKHFIFNLLLNIYFQHFQPFVKYLFSTFSTLNKTKEFNFSAKHETRKIKKYNFLNNLLQILNPMYSEFCEWCADDKMLESSFRIYF